MTQLLSHETAPLSWNSSSPVQGEVDDWVVGRGKYRRTSADIYFLIFFALFYITLHHSHHNTHRLPLSTFPSNPTFFSISFYPCLSLKLLDKISRIARLYPNQPLKTLSLHLFYKKPSSTGGTPVPPAKAGEAVPASPPNLAVEG